MLTPVEGARSNLFGYRNLSFRPAARGMGAFGVISAVCEQLGRGPLRGRSDLADFPAAISGGA